MTAARSEGAEALSVFTSHDLDLGAWLLSQGIEPAKVEPPARYSHSGLSTLIYRRTSDLEEALEEWEGSEPMTVNLRSFIECRYTLYERIKRVRQEARR